MKKSSRRPLFFMFSAHPGASNRPQLMRRLADFYHVSVDYLLERTDQKSPYPPKK